MLHHFTRPKPLAWFFFLLGLATTVALGTWQVQRLAWKEGLIAAIETANRAAPLASVPRTAAAQKAKEFYRVNLQGAWVEGIEFPVAARYYKGKLGYHLFTPFKLKDGRIVIVNRGWVPADLHDASTRPELAASGEATLTGMLRFGADRNYFTPPSQPEKTIWFGRDVAQMGASAKLADVVPEVSVDLIGKQAWDTLPIPSSGAVKLRNDHLSYIITWYGIALGILVIFLTYHRTPRA
jgi:surfeit locus 1 family protein